MDEDAESSVFLAVAAREPDARRRTENVWQFLERSSEPAAATTRAQWDGWLTRLSPGLRKDLIRRLRDRSDEQVRAALAELATFVVQDSVYPAVEMDPATGFGSRADFAATAPVRTHFEVHRPAPSKDVAMDARRQGDIAEELAKIDSPDFWLDVQVRSGTQVPSMRSARREAEEWLASLDYGAEVQHRNEHQRDRLGRAAKEMPGLDAGPVVEQRLLTQEQHLVQWVNEVNRDIAVLEQRIRSTATR